MYVWLHYTFGLHWLPRSVAVGSFCHTVLPLRLFCRFLFGLDYRCSSLLPLVTHISARLRSAFAVVPFCTLRSVCGSHTFATYAVALPLLVTATFITRFTRGCHYGLPVATCRLHYLRVYVTVTRVPVTHICVTHYRSYRLVTVLLYIHGCWVLHRAVPRYATPVCTFVTHHTYTAAFCRAPVRAPHNTHHTHTHCVTARLHTLLVGWFGYGWLRSACIRGYARSTHAPHTPAIYCYLTQFGSAWFIRGWLVAVRLPFVRYARGWFTHTFCTRLPHRCLYRSHAHCRRFVHMPTHSAAVYTHAFYTHWFVCVRRLPTFYVLVTRLRTYAVAHVAARLLRSHLPLYTHVLPVVRGSAIYPSSQLPVLPVPVQFYHSSRLPPTFCGCPVARTLRLPGYRTRGLRLVLPARRYYRTAPAVVAGLRLRLFTYPSFGYGFPVAVTFGFCCTVLRSCGYTHVATRFTYVACTHIRVYIRGLFTFTVTVRILVMRYALVYVYCGYRLQFAVRFDSFPRWVGLGLPPRHHAHLPHTRCCARFACRFCLLLRARTVTRWLPACVLLPYRFTFVPRLPPLHTCAVYLAFHTPAVAILYGLPLHRYAALYVHRSVVRCATPRSSAIFYAAYALFLPFAHTRLVTFCLRFIHTTRTVLYGCVRLLRFTTPPLPFSSVTCGSRYAVDLVTARWFAPRYCCGCYAVGWLLRCTIHGYALYWCRGSAVATFTRLFVYLAVATGSAVTVRSTPLPRLRYRLVCARAHYRLRCTFHTAPLQFILGCTFVCYRSRYDGCVVYHTPHAYHRSSGFAFRFLTPPHTLPAIYAPVTAVHALCRLYAAHTVTVYIPRTRVAHGYCVTRSPHTPLPTHTAYTRG